MMRMSFPSVPAIGIPSSRWVSVLSLYKAPAEVSNDIPLVAEIGYIRFDEGKLRTLMHDGSNI